MKIRINKKFYIIAFSSICLCGCVSSSDSIKAVSISANGQHVTPETLKSNGVSLTDNYPVESLVQSISLADGGIATTNQLAAESDNYVEEVASGVDISHRYKYKVRGKHYKVFNNADSFQEIGIASWYGPGFHGKKTANGENYNMHVMTAAHKTLPLGSRVRVTNLENGKKITVRINDRGPFHSGRIIDLSKKAARKLDILGRGYARVHVRAIK